MHLYRIAQEAINNATRHGKAESIHISLAAAGGVVTLRIADDGVGMTGLTSTGVGLGLMQYRTRLMGGELTIEQPESGGTAISCTAREDQRTNGTLAR